MLSAKVALVVVVVGSLRQAPSGGGGVFFGCVPEITIHQDFFVTTTTQGGQVIGLVTELVGLEISTSGCEWVGT